MTSPEYLRLAVVTALSLLPKKMQSPEAYAMLVAIALQESGGIRRRQVNGPARSFWQFEVGGIRGVLTHPQSKPHIADLLALLSYPVTDDATVPYIAIEHNDTLAAVFARLLLWTDGDPCPPKAEPEKGWQMYARLWRPGKPRPETWAANFQAGWALV